MNITSYMQKLSNFQALPDRKPQNFIEIFHAVNADECLLTRLQEMSLDYHFKIEQEAGSSCFAFFGFNGKILLLPKTKPVFTYTPLLRL